jgi:hypothetical protein
MTESHPALQLFGPRHALSLRGLQVRDNSGQWKLVVPMSPELLEPVRALCERVTLAEAASVLDVLERYLRADLERLLELRERDTTSGDRACR